MPEIPIEEEYEEKEYGDPYEYDDYGLATKIVGGKVSTPNSYPFAAVLSSPKYRGHFCGGTLITRRHVVTAAHCFWGDPT